MSESVVKVAVVDSVQLRREVSAVACKLAGFETTGFANVADFASAEVDTDVVLFFPSVADVTRILAAVALLREQDKPVLVVTHESVNEKFVVRALLAGGAQGYLPSATSDMATAMAAIRFVADGGVYAPVDKLLNNKPAPKDEEEQGELTPRQKEVLECLRVGQPNKIIAYNLHMSESTVKVHIRNLMRRLSATNRTQAVYKAQLLA